MCIFHPAVGSNAGVGKTAANDKVLMVVYYPSRGQIG
jgi:hypothetical protein